MWTANAVANEQKAFRINTGITYYRRYCPDDSCKKSCGIHAGSFYERSKLPLQQWIVLIHWWVSEYHLSRAAEWAKTSEAIAIQAVAVIGGRQRGGDPN